MSYTTFKTSDLRPLGKLFLSVFSLLKLVHVEAGVGEDKESTRVNNLTLLNFLLKILGPLHERTLTLIILGIQVSLNLNLQYINRSLILNSSLPFRQDTHKVCMPWQILVYSFLTKIVCRWLAYQVIESGKLHVLSW